MRHRPQTIVVFRVSSCACTLVQMFTGRDASVRAVTVVETEQATYVAAALSTGYLSIYPIDVQ